MQRFEKARKELRETDVDRDIELLDDEKCVDDEADDDDSSTSFNGTSEAYKSFVRRTQQLQTELTPERVAWFNLQKIGLFCLAKQPEEMIYNRAQIVSVSSENKFTVLYVDYGDILTLDATDLLPIEERLVKLLPFQAIECSLDGLKPYPEVNI